MKFGTQFVCQGSVGPYRVDFLFQLNGPKGQRYLAVECDGHDFHEKTKLQVQRDKSRDRGVKMHGLDVIRFTGSEIFCDPKKCADEVTAHLGNIMEALIDGSQPAKLR
jgi:very-short-patch-repair endonuclease